MNKLQSAISLARRSGHLVTGFDRVKELVETKGTKLVLTARDLSEKSRARVERFCEGRADVIHTGLTMEDIYPAAGKTTGILAADDVNMSDLLRKAAESMKGEH